jgi:hypothetical protein
MKFSNKMENLSNADDAKEWVHFLSARKKSEEKNC